METKYEIGFVTKAADYLLTIEGLPTAKINDVVLTEKGDRAIVTALLGGQIEALMLDSERPRPGEILKNTGEGLRLTLGEHLLGRAINPLGFPVDGRSPLPPTNSKLDLDVVAPGTPYREMITDQIQTGFAIVDLLLPIAKGQRQLIFGDARSGKSSFLLDLIANQKDQNIICVYTSVGRPEVDTKRFVLDLEKSGAATYTVVVAAASSSSAPLIALSPTVALSVADTFCRQGQDVLLIFDDLGTHSKYLREIALLSQQVPGRESYPADIFYAHAHLIERAGRFTKELGGGSITLLPVIETDLENFTALIPTNLISQTDGHLLFSSLLRAQGLYPAVDWSLSVTRVGRQTQSNLLRSIGSQIRRLLAEYQELQRYSQFESELPTETQLKLKQAEMTLELLNQEGSTFLNFKAQAALLTLVYTPFLINRDRQFVISHKEKIVEALQKEPELLSLVQKDWDSMEGLKSALTEKIQLLENYVNSQ